jgi:hypothetical protein
MMIFKKALPRRSFLRGAGVSLALPFLDAMIPALAASDAAKPPMRLGYIYLPTGRIMDAWTPDKTGSNYDIKPTLKPFEKFHEQMSVLSGLDIKAADMKPGERGGSHPRPCAAYLTGVHPYNDSVGISADQVVAKVIGQDTPLASMQLGVDPPEWANGVDGSFRGFYRSTLSWATSSNALPTQDNPRKVFERLFGDTSSLDPETLRRRNQRNASILDGVSDRVNQLMGSVNAGDRYKLEEYLEAVRDIERGIEAAESQSHDSAAFEGIKRPSGIPDNYGEHARLIFDMMYLAYLTDMTRVVTMMMGHEGTNRNYMELGAKDGHHSLSHHRGDPITIDLLKKIELYQNEQLGYFLERMRAAKEQDGTSLLDNSVIVAGSGMSDGNVHYHYDVPTLVFGSAQGRLRRGQHIRYNKEPLSNLHLLVIDMFGATPEEYLSNDTSDASGILKGLT